MRSSPFARFLIPLVAALVVLPLVGCVSRQAAPESAYVVNSQGAVAPIARSALAGSTAPGKQEIIGIYVPFVGTGLAIKAGLEWDGTPTVIEVPVANAPAAQSAPQYVETQETYYEPETRMVPKTRTVRRALVPVPAAAPQSKPCPMPPPEPVAMAAPLPDGVCHGSSCMVASAK